MKLLLTTIALALLPIFSTGCGSSGGGGGEETETVTQPTTPKILSNNPPCESLAFDDGRGGDLWLHHSESTGLPVYLLNNGWQDPTTVDAVLHGGGLERANFTGFANPDAGIDRPHFRFARGCSAYTGALIVTDASKVCEVQLPAHPCTRID